MSNHLDISTFIAAIKEFKQTLPNNPATPSELSLAKIVKDLVKKNPNELSESFVFKTVFGKSYSGLDYLDPSYCKNSEYVALAKFFGNLYIPDDMYDDIISRAITAATRVREGYWSRTGIIYAGRCRTFGCSFELKAEFSSRLLITTISPIHEATSDGVFGEIINLIKAEIMKVGSIPEMSVHNVSDVYSALDRVILPTVSTLNKALRSIPVESLINKEKARIIKQTGLSLEYLTSLF